jgi:hypothetical protein
MICAQQQNIILLAPVFEPGLYFLFLFLHTQCNESKMHQPKAAVLIDGGLFFVYRDSKLSNLHMNIFLDTHILEVYTLT